MKLDDLHKAKPGARLKKRFNKRIQPGDLSTESPISIMMKQVSDKVNTTPNMSKPADIRGKGRQL